jgi:hypothetical protein
VTIRVRPGKSNLYSDGDLSIKVQNNGSKDEEVKSKYYQFLGSNTVSGKVLSRNYPQKSSSEFTGNNCTTDAVYHRFQFSAEKGHFKSFDNHT